MKTNLAVLLLISLITSFSWAQEPARPAKTKKARVSVTFDDELVKGGTMLPDGDLISNRLDNRFKRFIKVRKDFIQDVENTKDEFGHK